MFMASLRLLHFGIDWKNEAAREVMCAAEPKTKADCLMSASATCWMCHLCTLSCVEKTILGQMPMALRSEHRIDELHVSLRGLFCP